MKKVLLAVAAMALMAAPAMAAAPSSLTAGGGLRTAQYHSYDGLICTDCHTLHGSEDGAQITAGRGVGELWTGVDVNAQGGYRELLKKGDWTDMCLSCHKQGYNTAATVDLPGVTVTGAGWVAPIVMTTGGVTPDGYSMPAGDFYFADQDPKKGHNPSYTKGATVAGGPTSKMIQGDATLKATPPGLGTGTALLGTGDKEWSCHSCHGMHSRFSGSYGAYRQLKRVVNGVTVIGDVTSTNVPTNPVETITYSKVTSSGYEPILSNSRGDIVGTEYKVVRPDGSALDGANLVGDNYGDTNKNVYRGGFSSFCSACHGNFHGGNGEVEGTDNSKTHVGGAWIKHPTNVVMADTATGGATTRKYGMSTYKAPVTNSQGVTGLNPVGYDYKYPLVKDNADTSLTVTGAARTVAATLAGSDKIMCLTCHKAHASQYDNMVRWDANAHSFLAAGSADMDGQTFTGDNLAYGCGKCHQKGGLKAYKKTGL